MLLKGQVAVVTGAAQGIGRAICSRFREEGAIVVMADLVETRPLDDGLPDEPTVRCDVTSEQDVERLFEETLARHGRVDILVNNAGITRDAMAHKMTLDEFEQVIDVHLRGTWLTTRSAMRHMRSRPGGGAIVNMSSSSGKTGNVGQTNYSAAKAGIVGMTKSYAKEGARLGIRVNAIQPGLIRTAMTEQLPQHIFDQKASEVPMERAGEPKEVASVAAFLASDLASYVTGAVIEVSGGRHM